MGATAVASVLGVSEAIPLMSRLAMSHRARAVQALRPWLLKRIGTEDER